MPEQKPEEKKTVTEEELVHQFDQKSTKMPNPKLLILVLVVILLGAGSGFVIAKGTVSQVKTSNEIKDASQVTKGTALGSNDTSTFKDTAEGVLKTGGIDGEGQYHLERSGGDSQNVYLTSSTLDLSLVKERKVKVWGQTQKAQHAGWLMDVGRVEVLE